MDFTGERIVPGADNCEPTFAHKMYQEHVARYAFAAQLVKGCSVLDVACGVGYGSQWLGKAGAERVIAIDIAEDAIDHAKKNYFHPNVTFHAQNALEIEFENEFDVVTCFEFIEHIDDQARALDAIKKALRPNGILIISTPRPLDEKRTHFHAHELEYQELRRMLTHRFSDVRSYFEKNCFTSYVGEQTPTTVDSLISVSNTISLEYADYFIFVASSSGAERQLGPVMVLNDDEYVLRLEQDIVNLRNGENYHNGIISDLTGARDNLKRSVQELEKEAGDQRRRAEDAADMRQQLAKIESEVASVREAVQQTPKLATLEEELRSVHRSRDDLAHQTEKLILENGKIRTVLSKVSQQLAETETQLTSRQGELAAAETKVADARNALSTLRADYEASQSTLNRFRKSVSWRLTRPVRWIGRTAKRVGGRKSA